MPKIISLCALLFLIPQQRQCDMVSPESIRSKVEAALQPYFANARGEVSPNQGAIVGYTCLFGAGPELPAKIQESLASNREMIQQLSMIKIAPLVGGASYRYFFLGFDNGLIRYDMQARQMVTMAPPAGYVEHYHAICGQ